MPISLPSSKPQANVASYLEQFRKIYLQQALSSAIQAVNLRIINKQLDELAPARELRKLASQGIRGEFVFAVPAILAIKLYLLGYYRLLLGYSQKEFYQKSKLGRLRFWRQKVNYPSALKQNCRNSAAL